MKIRYNVQSKQYRFIELTEADVLLISSAIYEYQQLLEKQNVMPKGFVPLGVLRKRAYIKKVKLEQTEKMLDALYWQFNQLNNILAQKLKDAKSETSNGG